MEVIQIQEYKIFSAIKKLWGFLSIKKKFQLIQLLFLMLICGLVELISLASVIPFLIVLTDPSKLKGISFFKYIFEYLNLSSQKEILIFTTILFGLASLITMVIRLSNLWLNGSISANIGSELSNKVYMTMLYKPYDWHVKVNTSELINDATNNVGFAVFFIKSCLTLLTQISVATSLLIGLLIIDGFSAIISATVFSGTYIVLALFVRKRFEKNGKFMVLSNEKQLRNLQEGFGSIREVILDNLQFNLLDSYKKIDFPNRLRQAENEFLKTAPRFTLETICLLLISFLALTLSITRGSSATVLTTLGTLALGAQKLLPAMQGIYSDWAGLRNFYPGVCSILSILSSAELKFIDINQHDATPFKREIKLKNLYFSYHEDRKENVLENVNLTLKKGQKIGIVGKTGCGKSTLVDLIMGLLVPDQGAVEIDGKSIDYANKEEIAKWRLNISHVPQSIFLTDSSLLENIAFGVDRKNIDLDKVKQSAKQAEILDFIMELPSGFNTYIGERGVRLSGGQRQRIGIARALYKKSNVIIFDEATSALDNETEKSVIESIDNFSKKDNTIIMIAHRLSTLKTCDKIYEVSNYGINEISLGNE